MRFVRFVGLLLIALGAAAPASAEIEAQVIGSGRGAVRIDPAKAYIFYRSSEPVGMLFLREVTAEQRSAWSQARAAAYPAAQRRYERLMREWQAQRDSCGNRCMNPLPRPVAFTEETFAYPVAELSNFVPVVRWRQFARAQGEHLYLIAVPPGTYILYGQMEEGAGGGWIGVCLCMGSLRFEARAGEVADMGRIEYPLQAALRGGARHSAGAPGRPSSVAVVPAEPGAQAPERLAGARIYPADYRSAGRMENYLGVEIDRIRPLAGVIAYDRDRVVDLKAAAGAQGGR